MTLYQQLQIEMQDHRDFWNYYGDNFDNVFRDEIAAGNFIYNYFKQGCKLCVLDSWENSIDEYTQMRNVHTVNVFFIGVFLQRMIDENIAIKSEVTSDYPFSYIWFLVCLAHDFGYVYEKYSQAYIGLPEGKYSARYYNTSTYFYEFRTRKCWYQKHGIDIAYLAPKFGKRTNFSYYNKKEFQRLDCNIEYNNGKIIKRPRYSQKSKNNYFYYRLYEMHTLDHGIVGADEFFSRLIVNYVKEYRAVAKKGYGENFYNFYNKRGRHFCSEQLKIFAYIADCIASHNMYMEGDNEKCRTKYIDYGLNCLLKDKFQLISYKDNPLLFILCVADTIEPSKKFTNYDNKEILSLISINYNVKENSLNVEIDAQLYNSTAGKSYVSGIKELEKWCDIKTTVEPICSVQNNFYNEV